PAPSPLRADVLAERQRQVTAEGGLLSAMMAIKIVSSLMLRLVTQFMHTTKVFLLPLMAVVSRLVETNKPAARPG
ncbi:hypothetical protein, partial [Raoultella planticola]|uniref:hypothetical protein n=1 Tax=Raoultella planticola TaxID=575 RepID=UPI001D0CE8BE